MDEDSRKPHRLRHSGPKADKKKAKNKHEQELTPQQRNPKAFAFHSVNKVAKSVKRTLDIHTKKTHIPEVDRTPVEPPPVVVAVVGPPKVGKTTLLSCLIKNFTKQKLTSVQGPVTIVSGKKRRLTFLECNNDVNSMIDVAKVADLVLLLIDASFGFEMETFEFLNICQVHGFPKIMGVLTHLDMFRNTKKLRKTKKRLKHRFWTEIYQGAKLFYLSGMVNGEYQKTEVHNLGRFISVMKFRPLHWRTTHPYLLADRMEDLTDPELIRQNAKCDRTVCLYGYVRGTHFKSNCNVHLPGAGDFSVKDISFLPDPCPLPERENRRSLNESERLIYAPMSGVGGIVYDKDAVYIDLGGSHSHTQQAVEEDAPINELVATMKNPMKTLEDKMATSELTLFKNAAPLTEADIHRMNLSGQQEEKTVADAVNGRDRRKAVFGENTDDEEDKDDDDDDEEDEDSDDEVGGDDEDTDGDEEQDETEEDFSKPGALKTEMFTRSAKKRKMDGEGENLAFADSDDDLEENFQLFTPVAEKKNTPRKQSNINSSSSSRGRGGGQHMDVEINYKADSETDSEMESTEIDDGVVEKKRKKRTKVSEQEQVTHRKGSREEKYGGLNDRIDEKQDSSDNECGEHVGNGAEDGSEEDEDDVEYQEKEDYDAREDNLNEESGLLRWKENIAEKASQSFLKNKQTNWRKIVYGHESEDYDGESEEEGEVGGLFKISKKKKDQRKGIDGFDCSRDATGQNQEWNIQELLESIQDCFVTGKWDKSEDAKALLDQDDDLYGAFEDLETGEVMEDHQQEDEEEEEDAEDGGGGEDKDVEKPKMKRDMTKEERKQKALDKRAEKKRKLKAMFDAEYDASGGGGEESFYDEWRSEMEQQAQLNRAEFENLDEDLRVQYEGFRPGLYVRVQLDNMPCEFIDHFDPTYPVILGALLSAEDTIGYVNLRVKKHRWHKKILKTKDPLIISLGWRRFQTIPLYSIQDHNMRQRLLKYTPEHMHCTASIWGPITPQGTGFLAVQTVAGTPDFRIAATGVVLELDKSVTVVKKLKLTGTPYKIYKKTAFIKGMFNSELEVSKFEGASIRAVSGIRGQIKKPVRTPEGAFRATFEDKLLLSDIVFVRTWYRVEVPKFYNPLTTLLFPLQQRSQWEGMKTLGQLKREKGIKAEANPDSSYKSIERKGRSFHPLVIPKHLQRDLPFKDKPKVATRQKDPVQAQRVAVVREPKERKVAELMKMLKTLHEHKMKQRRSQMRERAQQHEKDKRKIEMKRTEKQKVVKKQIYRVLGQIEKKKKRHEKE
ncbi:ribosome biogenesis protein BMS1 homolog isoform X2 [Lingula anatina]|nr:ribosome biogenesis protein BMS1 homolog isoform X2 [Lingula anatina]|eukprot:XP_013412523.1 ribosome biogenesis protein BMS1 homolog isoform X2 [Lingula anatina]